MKHALPRLFLILAVLPAPAQTRLQVKWELIANVYKNGDDEGTSRSAFVITNRDTKALPPQGWAIYFNSRYGVDSGSTTGGVRVEYVGSNLLRMVPTAAFQGLAPGQTLRAEYLANAPVLNYTDMPVGLYIVFDSDPAKGFALTDYTLAPMTRPEQLDKGPAESVPVVTPEAVYRQNEAIREISLAELPPVLPTPSHLERQAGTLHLAGLPGISADEGLKGEAAFAAELLKPYLTASRAEEPVLRLRVGRVEGQMGPEAYMLTVDAGTGVEIVGNTPAGVFNGLQSLRQLLPVRPQPGKGVDLPLLRVVDAPRFSYRGFLLDVARNFHPKAEVLRILDLMARYKLNTFHFHLTDDEGWRLEIPGLPELTSVSARRGHTLTSADFLPAVYGSGPDVDKPQGSGFYTRADYIEILQYAAARHIEVVPELEMPGHARAAVKAMEARTRRLAQAGDPDARKFLLSDPGDRSEYRSAQLYTDNVMNPAMESTYLFITKVVSEVAAIHAEAGVPLANLHMGGDEVPAGVWQKSPIAQAYMKEKRIASVDDLWFVFYRRVAAILRERGLRLSGWEEIGVRKTLLDGKPRNIVNPGFAAMGFRTYVWNNVLGWGSEDLAYRLANGGYQVVLCPVSNLYFDQAYNKNPDEPGYYWGAYIDTIAPFEFIPFDYFRNAKVDRRGNPLDRSIFIGKERLTDYGKQNILGIEGCLWSENLMVPGRLEYMLLPRLFALAERAWAPDPAWATEGDAARTDAAFRQDWSSFTSELGRRELPRLDQEGLRFGYRIPPPGLKVEGGHVLSNIQIPGFTLRFTTDRSDPTAKSPAVQGPIAAKGTIRVAAFNGEGRRSTVSQIENP